MKRAFLLLAAILCMSGAIRAQNIVIGERAPELKNVTWLASRNRRRPFVPRILPLVEQRLHGVAGRTPGSI